MWRYSAAIMKFTSATASSKLREAVIGGCVQELISSWGGGRFSFPLHRFIPLGQVQRGSILQANYIDGLYAEVSEATLSYLYSRVVGGMPLYIWCTEG